MNIGLSDAKVCDALQLFRVPQSVDFESPASASFKNMDSVVLTRSLKSKYEVELGIYLLNKFPRSLRVSLNDTVLFERLKSPNLALLGNSSKSLICEGSQQEC